MRAKVSVLTASPFRYLSPEIFNFPVFLKVRQFKRVVLPAPLAPMMARNSPGRTHPVTNCSNRERQDYCIRGRIRHWRNNWNTIFKDPFLNWCRSFETIALTCFQINLNIFPWIGRRRRCCKRNGKIAFAVALSFI